MMEIRGGSSHSLFLAGILALVSVAVTLPSSQADVGSASSSMNLDEVEVAPARVPRRAATALLHDPENGAVTSAEADLRDEEEEGEAGHLASNYVALFYGPSLSEPKNYQTNPAGKYDRDRPVHIRNFISLGYHLTDDFTITPTAYWTYAPLISENKLEMQDPYLQFALSNIVNQEGWYLYADVRVHFPVSATSRANKMRGGLQTFQLLTYSPSDTITFGMNLSEHYSNFAPTGLGDDLSLHIAPSVSYGVNDTLALTVMYWAEASHRFGDKAFSFNNDGTALEPGVGWSITPNIYLNPYVSIQTGGEVSLKTTNIGALFNWQLI